MASLLTVAKIESGAVVLLTDDLRFVELPITFLPDSIPSVGDTFQINIDGKERTTDEKDQFKALQEKILLSFGSFPDVSKIETALEHQGTSHTTVLLSWPSWSVFFPKEAILPKLYSIECLVEGFESGTRKIQPFNNAIHDEQRLSTLSLADSAPINQGFLRVTGLEPEHPYSFKLIFRSRSGTFTTNTVSVHTPPLSNLSCLTIFILSKELSEEDKAEIEIMVTELKLTLLDTFDINRVTHVIKFECTEETITAICREHSIPMVSLDWLRSCHRDKIMHSVSQFSLPETIQ